MNCGNNKELLCCVKATDEHCNTVLENVKVIQTKVPKNNKGKKSKPVNMDPYISKMLL